MKERVSALSQLQHPALPRVHHLACLDGQTVLVADPSHSVRLPLVSKTPTGARAALEIGSALASCLHAVFDGTGLVHGGLHAGCVRVTPYGEVGLRGFVGLQDATGIEVQLAPEVLSGETPTHRSDVYALGALVYELVTGEPLLTDERLDAVVHGGLRPDTYVRAIEERLASLPSSLATVLGPALDFDATARPTALGLLEAFEDLERLPGPSLRRWARTEVVPHPSPGPLSGQTVRVQTEQVGALGFTSSFAADTPIDVSREELPTVLASGSRIDFMRSGVSDVRTTIGNSHAEGVWTEPSRPPISHSLDTLNQGPLPEPTQIMEAPAPSIHPWFVLAAGVLLLASVLLLPAVALLTMR